MHRLPSRSNVTHTSRVLHSAVTMATRKHTHTLFKLHGHAQTNTSIGPPANRLSSWHAGDQGLTIFGEDRLGVVVQCVGDGDGRTHTHDGGERQHQTNHHSRKVHRRHCVQDHCGGIGRRRV